MKLNAKISLMILFPLLAGLTGCIKEEQYPLKPAIEFGSVKALKDVSGKDSTLFVTISYTDGDGNIGLPSSDTVEPYKYNYYMNFYQYINKKLVEFEPVEEAITFDARIPVLTPAGKNKNIKGDITRSFQIYFARQLLQSDTIAFEIYIKDRTLFESNVVMTPLIVIKR
jgi:hypothetical protein